MLTGSRQPAISPQRGQDQNIESYIDNIYQLCNDNKAAVIVAIMGKHLKKKSFEIESY